MTYYSTVSLLFYRVYPIKEKRSGLLLEKNPPYLLNEDQNSYRTEHE